MNKQQLAAKIWESANQMRSKIEANDYKDYILGFIFYKYLSDNEVKYVKSKGCSEEDIEALSEEDIETSENIRRNLGYFISYENLFSTWIKAGKDFDVSNVRDALSAFDRLISKEHKKLFYKIFETLQTGLSKLGESAGAQTKAISGLIHLIKAIPMDGKQDYDVLGFIYEYLISMFAANAGKKAGEFYTPHEVSLLMSEIVADHLKDRAEIEIYDPTSGSGSLLINIGQSVAKHMNGKNNVKYYAQEIKENTYNLTRMNLIMRGILVSNIVTRNGDTLEDDWPFFDENDPSNTYNPLYVDAVVSNPPYSQNWDSLNKETDPRYARFGVAPKSKADYAFLLHDLFHIKPDGIMTIVLPHGVLFRGGEEGQIRKNLIEGNHIDAIIGLPANIFFGTGIPTTILVLKQKRENTDVLIIDASKGFEKVGKNNKLRSSDIKKITDTVITRTHVAKFAKKVTREEIRENDYNLNIPRYVDSSEETESWDIYASMFGGIPKKEVNKLEKYWTVFSGLKDELFTNMESEYLELKTTDIKNEVQECKSVQIFIKEFKEAFDDYDKLLKSELLDNMMNIKLSKEENILSEDMFERLEAVSLVDKYNAYQFLDDEWKKIAADLEVIQTEGFEVTKKVDPNMVMKKKAGKEQEVQEGWNGHVIPFEIVQEAYLTEELNQINSKENRLLEVTTEVEEIFDSFSEEEKEMDAINDAKDSFVTAGVRNEAKKIRVALKKKEVFSEDSYELKILKVEDLFTEGKVLKSKVKLEKDKLQILTKVKMGSLTDEQVYELLNLKWIVPLMSSLNRLPEESINNLIKKIQELEEKYATTYADIENQIVETEDVLTSLINDLTGNEYDMKGLNEFQMLLKGKSDA